MSEAQRGRKHTPESREKMKSVQRELKRQMTPEAKSKPGHTRWHVNKGILKPGCPLCETIADAAGGRSRS